MKQFKLILHQALRWYAFNSNENVILYWPKTLVLSLHFRHCSLDELFAKPKSNIFGRLCSVGKLFWVSKLNYIFLLSKGFAHWASSSNDVTLFLHSYAATWRTLHQPLRWANIACWASFLSMTTSLPLLGVWNSKKTKQKLVNAKKIIYHTRVL